MLDTYNRYKVNPIAAMTANNHGNNTLLCPPSVYTGGLAWLMAVGRGRDGREEGIMVRERGGMCCDGPSLFRQRDDHFAIDCIVGGLPAPPMVVDRIVAGHF